MAILSICSRGITCSIRSTSPNHVLSIRPLSRALQLLQGPQKKSISCVKVAEVLHPSPSPSSVFSLSCTQGLFVDLFEENGFTGKSERIVGSGRQKNVKLQPLLERVWSLRVQQCDSVVC
jgi:hypothetical protein